MIETERFPPRSRFIFIGESIHGVLEFTLFKQDFVRQYGKPDWIWLFEADRLGMALSDQRQEPASQRLSNFPAVMRTMEIQELLDTAIQRGIVCLGVDCIPRRALQDFPAHWRQRRQCQIDRYQTMKNQPDYHEWREENMALAITETAGRHPDSTLLIMMHNLHIKRQGSKEIPTLKLTSVRERLEKINPGQMTSIAQFALAGNAVHNNLMPFHFHINDERAVESLAASDERQYRILPCSAIPTDYVAWHHAGERETLPVRNQYEWCVVFSRVTAPRFTAE